MLLQLTIFTIGIIILYLGAEWLIKGASRMALHYGLRPLVVGLTVVALGTSLPEFFVNFFAALTGESQIALGNIIGSNICNIAFIVGASALILPLAVKPQMLRKEYPLMMGAMILFYLLALDGSITRRDGVLLVVSLIGVMAFLFIDAQRHPHTSMMEDPPDVDPEDPLASPWAKTLHVVGGMIFLAGGAHLMVRGAVHIADFMGVDHVVIGLTIVAIGTSLPELAASMVGALKDEADLSVGNVLGSNLLNVLFVVGTVALISPLEVEPISLTLHFPVMLGFCILFLPLAWTGHCITRLEGSVLVVGFIGYLAYLVMPYV